MPKFGSGLPEKQIGIMEIKIKYVVSVPFRADHIQCNPRVPWQIVFCCQQVIKPLLPTIRIRPLVPVAQKCRFNRPCFQKTAAH
jgi:hypothetical protein